MSSLAKPALASGLSMAMYLLTRPYGDHSPDHVAAAAALSSSWWIPSHLFGALALLQFARLGWRLHDLYGCRETHALRTFALVGASFCLPYYGAESFALHVLATHGQAGLVDDVRSQPLALATFAIGLLALIASGLLLPWVWARLGHSPWPAIVLGLAMAFFPVHYFLPDALRQGFGVVYLACAAVFALGTARPGRARAGLGALRPAESPRR